MKALTRLSDGSVELRINGYTPLNLNGTMYCGYKVDQKFIEFAKSVHGVSGLDEARLWTLYQLATQCLQLDGDYFECGVHKGGSAKFLAQIMTGSDRKLHLFDTFTGMPKTNEEVDIHVEGDFGDAKLEEVREYVGHEEDVVFHPGFMPDTFPETEYPLLERIAFAHVDVDIYQSMKDCCEYIYPRLVLGGVMVLDDYGQITCPGARFAVDEYFAGKRSIPLAIFGGQAIVFKI